MEQSNILDDLKDLEENNHAMNGTWSEWWRGLVIGIIVHSFFDFLNIKFSHQVSEFDTILPLAIIHLSTIFISVFSYLFFSSAARQPFKRILLLALISSIFYCFSFIIALSIANESSVYHEFVFYLEHWHIMVSSFVKNFIFFLFTALLFRKKLRYIGIALIVITLILAGFM